MHFQISWFSSLYLYVFETAELEEYKNGHFMLDF